MWMALMRYRMHSTYMGQLSAGSALLASYVLPLFSLNRQLLLQEQRSRRLWPEIFADAQATPRSMTL